MTEETPNPDQVPAEPAPLPPVPPVNLEESQTPPPAAESPFAETPEPAAAAPDPWAPAPQATYPSPEEDAVLREERARRFGTPESESSTPFSDAPASDAGNDFGSPTPFEPATEDPAPPFEPAAAAVTPLPATPATTQLPASTYPEQGPDTGFPPVGAPSPTYDEFQDLDEGPASRAAAHWWSILITLVFAPVSWFLFTHGGAWIFTQIPAETPITVAAYVTFGFGLLTLFIYLLAARWSSLGSIIIGSLVFALGIASLIFPTDSVRILEDGYTYFARLGGFGKNLHDHLMVTLITGRMAVYGLVMIMVGVVSHGARRQGRREERTKIALGE